MKHLAKDTQYKDRYGNKLECYDCGCPITEGYEERYESETDGSYSETLYICQDCLKAQLEIISYPHASDCAIWVREKCDCKMGKYIN